MTNKEMKELLEKQLQLLSEQSKTSDAHGLSEAAVAMCSLMVAIRQCAVEERREVPRPHCAL